jgi:hypothetical protein
VERAPAYGQKNQKLVKLAPYMMAKMTDFVKGNPLKTYNTNKFNYLNG